ncbi:MAG: hydroxyacid dehydrogenase [Candidatus Pacebacteria bacterium]|nr:hydroxyacid dehydrogenase [Candidatus Paceibacterota bacterium]
MRIAIFRYEDWEKKLLEEELQGHDITFFEKGLTKDELPQENDFEVVIVFVDSEVTEEIISHFPKLSLIATRSTGFDHIDFQAAKNKEVKIAYVPAYGEETVAEFAFALLLTLSRKIYQSYNRVRETGSFELTGLRGFDLNRKTLGVIGTGKIGRNVIQIAKGFDMNVIAYDPYPNAEAAEKLGFVYKTLEEVLKESDIVTLHVPYMESTHHLLNDKTFALMKDGAYLVNTSRGAIVDTEALARALKSGKIAGAGLDVLEEEGAIKDELNLLAEGHPEEHNLKTILTNHVLIDLPNVIVTPHNAFNTAEALQRITQTTIDNIKNFTEGKEFCEVK